MKLVKSLAILKLAQAYLDGTCSVNNGGCSHQCTQVSDAQYYCECPRCWTLTEELKCTPDDTKITTSCGHDSMMISMHKCILEDTHDWTTAAMIDGQECMFEQDPDEDDYVMLTNGLDDCGMTLSYNAANETLIYSNTLLVQPASIGGMIVTAPKIEWEFSCEFDTEYEIGESLDVNSASIVQEFSQTNAQFAFSFDFYTDGTFTDSSMEPSFQVGERVNFGVTMNNGVALSSLDFVASQCEVTNGDLTYVIYDMNNPDHCEAGAPVYFDRVSSNPAANFYSYIGFSFMNEETESSSQRISCTVKVCHEDDSESACVSGCYATIQSDDNSTAIDG